MQAEEGKVLGSRQALLLQSNLCNLQSSNL